MLLMQYGSAKMSNNGSVATRRFTSSVLSPLPVEQWDASATKVPHPYIKAYQPHIMDRGLRRFFKTKTSASNYALAVIMRYKRLLEER